MLQPQSAALLDVGERQADQEREADVPQGKGGSGKGDEALSFVLAEVARAQGQLGSGEKQDNAQHRLRKDIKQGVNGCAEEQRKA